MSEATAPRESATEPRPAKIRFDCPLHPVFFATYPLLSMYVENLDQVPFTQIATSLIKSMIATVVIWAVLLFLLRSVRKSAVGASSSIFAIYCYRHLTNLVPQQYLPAIVAIEIVAVILVLAALFKTRQPLRDITATLNLAGGFLVAWPGIVIGIGSWRALRPDEHIADRLPFLTQEGRDAARRHSSRIRGAVTAATADLPDVYYIILDAYGRADSLKMFYGYDNTPFIKALESRGFYVADKSRANYNWTALCLPSALNFTYLDELAQKTGPVCPNEPFRRMLDDNRVAASLSKFGYKYVYIPSWSRSEEVITADVVLNKQIDIPLIESDLVNLDALRPNSPLRLHKYDLHRNCLIGAFDSLDSVGRLPDKKFVFAHVLAPHPPFVLGPNGEPKYPLGPWNTADASYLMRAITPKQYITGYIEQLRYINKRTIQAIDAILSQSKRPPIIIVQGDHGSRMKLDSFDLAKTDAREPFSILNAYYVPKKVRAHLYPTISPVNTFRILLNDVFDAHYDLLPDRSYYSTTLEICKFTDVTPLTAMPTESDPVKEIPAPPDGPKR